VSTTARGVVAVIAARDEGATIAETVRAASALPGVVEVVVADDGSRDDTARNASAAGAVVLRTPRSAGKGGALEAAVGRTAPASIWLFLDGDLGRSAAGLAPVLDVVRAGRADVAIAVPPPLGGGFGIVRRFASAAIRALCGLATRAPLSGQRAVSDAALRRVRPFAAGFGVETAMTIDAVRAGLRVVEVSAPFTHRPTGRDVAGFLHRGRQGLAIVRVVLVRAARRGRHP
jgi:glycosyltransferase involved in cell wall biosynthesis